MPQHDDHDDPAAHDDSGVGSAFDALRGYEPSVARDDSGAGSAFDALREYEPSVARDDSGAGSAFDALREYETAEPEDTGTELGAIRSQTQASEEKEEDEEDAGQLFTVTNPPRTVAVSALLDGRFERVHLSPEATNMSASQLADEILVLADLARQKGLAGQHTFLLESPDVSEFMGETGATGEDDSAVARDFLENDMGLVSPEHAEAAQAEVFATRYGHDHD
jgi:hypothetical protein